MAKKITIEIDQSYEEKLEVLRKVFVWPEGKQLENNWELLQGLMDTFIEFLQNQGGEDGHVHWEHCNH